MLKIIQANYLEEFKVVLKFNDGRTGEVDLANFLQHESRAVFLPLRNKQVFQTFTVQANTLTWQDGEIDLAPEFLYFLAFRNEPTLQEQFQKWGYFGVSK